MYGPQARFFEDEIRPHLRHKKKGTLGMASTPRPAVCLLKARSAAAPESGCMLRSSARRLTGGGENLNASQFYVTTGADLDSLDDKHTVFGEVGPPLFQRLPGGVAGTA